jgi:hypothetical protein
MELKLLLFFLFITQVFFAQQGITLSYNNVHTGRNVSIRHSIITNKKSDLSVGLKYHFNRYPIHDDNNLFYKAIDAKNAIQHFGIESQYSRIIKKAKNPFRFFYNAEYSYAGTSNVFYFPTDKKNIYRREDIEFKAMNMLEQNIGLSLSPKLSKNIFLNLNMGGGIIYFWRIDKGIIANYSNHTLWSFSKILSVGFTYQYGK